MALYQEEVNLQTFVIIQCIFVVNTCMYMLMCTCFLVVVGSFGFCFGFIIIIIIIIIIIYKQRSSTWSLHFRILRRFISTVAYRYKHLMSLGHYSYL